MQYNLWFGPITAYPAAWLLLLSSCISVMWLTYVYRRRHLHSTGLTVVFSAFAVCAAIWALTNAYFHSQLLTRHIGPAVFMALLANLVSGFDAALLYYLSCLLVIKENRPFKQIKVWRLKPFPRTMLFTVCAGSLLLNGIPGLVVTEVRLTPSDFTLVYGPLAWLYYLLAVAPAVPMVWNLIKAMRIDLKSSRIFVAKYFLTAGLLVYVAAMFTNVIGPLFFSHFNLTWFPPSIHCISVALVGYAIACERWLDELRPFMMRALQLLLYAVIMFLILIALQVIWQDIMGRPFGLE
ncbi:MAG: hypothetical protein GY841_01130 [FCB group bacterium]|nr:hypothetical protein [FCB group bacterium]